MRRLLCVLCVLLPLVACGGGSSPAAPTTIPPQPYTVTDISVGTGAEAVTGKSVTVNYAVWLFRLNVEQNKGQLIDTSVGRAPLTFTIGTVGAGGVIPGFDRGVTGMKVGGIRRLIVPPDLAYGAAGSGSVPPNSNLVFDIELLSVQ